VEGYNYDTFGNVERFGNAVQNTYGFTGREYDIETGLYYYRARYYDPETGRFISKDPIGFAGGDANLYNYVLGDPINWGDPWGLSRLVFDPPTNSLYVYPGDSFVLSPLVFPASNRVLNPKANPYEPGGFGPVPTGTFATGNLIETGGNPDSSFGSGFIPVTLPWNFLFYDKPRRGVGIHAGRANTARGYKYGTKGCIRTTEETLGVLRNDRPLQITVLPR